MISLTEKRLRELEGRYAVYEATIAQLKAKLMEVDAFPKEIASVKDNLKSHRSDLDHLYSTTNKKVNEANENFVQLKKVYESLTSEVKNLRLSLEEIKRQSADHSMMMNNLKDSIQKGQIDTRFQLSEHKQSLDSHAKGIDKVSDQTQAIDKKLKVANEFIANHSDFMMIAGNSIADLEKKHQNLADGLNSLLNSQINAGNRDEQLHQRLTAVESKTSLPAKDYDASIVGIKTDMAALLSLIHSPTQVSPDQVKINDKVKTMEQAIAQIYSLLKKYESR